MSTQLGLPFESSAVREVRRVHRGDPDTSRMAARASHGLASRHCLLILEVLRSSSSALAAHEIAASCNLEPIQVSDRLASTPSGRPAQTWRLP